MHTLTTQYTLPIDRSIDRSIMSNVLLSSNTNPSSSESKRLEELDTTATTFAVEETNRIQPDINRIEKEKTTSTFFGYFSSAKGSNRFNLSSAIGSTSTDPNDAAPAHASRSSILLQDDVHYRVQKDIFHISESGEFEDKNYHEQASSSMYSRLIGRKQCEMHNKSNFTQRDIQYEGYLHKKGTWFKTWKKRYFILRSDISALCYYSSKEDMILLGTIPLDISTSVDIEVDTEDTTQREMIVVKHASKAYDPVLIHSEIIQDRDRWYWEIQMAIAASNNLNATQKKTDSQEASMHWWARTFDSAQEIQSVRHYNEHSSNIVSELVQNLLINDMKQTNVVDNNRKELSKVEKKRPLKDKYLTNFYDDEMSGSLSGSLSGYLVAVQICHLSSNDDRIFVIFYGSTEDVDKGVEAIKWEHICHTEDHRVSSPNHDAMFFLPSVEVRFNVLQEKFASKYTLIKVELHKLGSKESTEKLDIDGWQASSLQKSLGDFVFARTSVASLDSFRFKMHVDKKHTAMHLDSMLPVSLVVPTITVGIQSIHSNAMYARMKALKDVIGVDPYGDMLYSFPTHDNQQVLSLEQIYAVDDGVRVSYGVAKLFSDERSRLISDMVVACGIELRMLEANQKVMSGLGVKDASIAALVDMDSYEAEFMHKFERVKRADLTLKGLLSETVEAKTNANKHCIDALSGEINGHIIGALEGGCVLRRSVWKKTPTWQYCTTNLNIHVMSSHSVLPTVPMSSEKAKLSRTDIHTIPTITLGCPAAHTMKFHHGGLFRSFCSIDSEGRRLLWMLAVQSMNQSDLVKLAAKYPKDAVALFGNAVTKVLTTDSNEVSSKVDFVSKQHEIGRRLDICASQALGCAICSVRLCIHLAKLHGEKYFDALSRSLRIGFYVSFESMLSTFGDELGMIEDLVVAAEWLSLVSLRLVKVCGTHKKGSPSMHRKGETIDYDGYHMSRDCNGRIVVDVAIDDEAAAVVMKAYEQTKGYNASTATTTSTSTDSMTDSDIADVSLSKGIVFSEQIHFPSTVSGNATSKCYAVVPLFGVVFTQGVNEMQSIALLSNRADIQRQLDMNKLSLCRIKRYFDRYSSILMYHNQSSNITDIATAVPAVLASATHKSRWKRALNKVSIECTRTLDMAQVKLRSLQHAITKSEISMREKHVLVLLRSSDLCRFMGGSVAILCKSGKDRTAMGVTLDITKALVEELNVVDGKEVCNILRGSGVRRMNVYANTAQPMYAFNDIQRLALPVCYRPPSNTYSGSVNS